MTQRQWHVFGLAMALAATPLAAHTTAAMAQNGVRVGHALGNRSMCWGVVKCSTAPSATSGCDDHFHQMDGFMQLITLKVHACAPS